MRIAAAIWQYIFMTAEVLHSDQNFLGGFNRLTEMNLFSFAAIYLFSTPAFRSWSFISNTKLVIPADSDFLIYMS